MQQIPKMLVVDDSDFNRVMLFNIFNGAYEVLEAADGECAVNLLNSNNIDIAIVDIVMPVMDGYEVLKYIRSNPKLANIPVIVSTSLSDLAEEKAFVLGADDFISKPFSVAIVKRRVENVMLRYRALNIKTAQANNNNLPVEEHFPNFMPCGVIKIKHKPGRYTFNAYNDIASSMFGYTKQEVESLFAGDLGMLIYKDDYRELALQLDKSEVIGKPMNLMCKFHCKGNEFKWVSVLASREISKQGKKTIIGVLIDQTKEKELELQLQQKLNYDELTKAHRFDSFCAKVRKMVVNKGENYAIARVGIKNFSFLSELIGCDEVDKLIIEIVKGLEDDVQNNGAVGRLDDGSFVIFAKASMLESNSKVCLPRIINDLDLSYDIQFCCGVYNIEDCNLPVQAMCRNANMAMDWANSNNTCCTWYNEEVKTFAKDRQIALAELTEDVKIGRIDLCFQPVYNQKGDIIAARALPLWRSSGGSVNFSKITRLTRGSNMSHRISNLLREQTFIYLNSWRRRAKVTVPIYVYITANQILNKHYFEDFKENFDKYRISPDWIMVEYGKGVENTNSVKAKILKESLAKLDIAVIDNPNPLEGQNATISIEEFEKLLANN